MRSVIVVQDAFTTYYDTGVLLDTLDLLRAIGMRPWLAPYRPNGKPLHVHGFLGSFERLAAGNAAALDRLAATGVDLVGLDPSMTLTYRSEYVAALPGRKPPPVQLLQEWLAARLDALPRIEGAPDYLFLPHCTERATAPATVAAWRRVFEACGITLTVLPSGCCCMAGTFGHEAENRALSEHIYELSWATHVKAAGCSGRLLADGFSCRSQAEIIDGVRLAHPVQALLAGLTHQPMAAE
jgi:Fe-S oxidoreductase